MKGYELFNRTLKDLKLGPIFGNPGSTEMPMLRGSEDYVLTLHDSISVGMADGYAQFSGRPSIVNLHTLPGIANSMAFIHTARTNRAPVIITSGQQDSRHAYYEPLLWHDLSDLVGSAVKYRYEVKNASDIERVLKRAYSLSMQPPAGPVFVSFPMDVMDEDAHYLDLDFSAVNRDIVDLQKVGYVAELISQAKNPAIVFGSEIDECNAHDAAIKFAEKLGAPVFGETLCSRSPFRSSSKRYAGDLSPATTPINLALLKHDLILNIGGDFIFYPYIPSPLLPGKKVVTITLSPSYKHGEYIVSNPRIFLEELTKVITQKGNFISPEDPGLNGLIAREKKVMGPNYLLQKVRKTFQGYTIIDESISSSPLLRKNLGYTDRSYFTAKSGQLGWGLPAAAGISMHKNKVLEIVGDGSLMYTVQALWTISRYSLPVKILVLNNEGYTILKSFSTSYYPGLEKAPYLTIKNNISEVASAFGVESRIADPELRELEWLREGDSPKLLVVNMPKTVPKLFM